MALDPRIALQAIGIQAPDVLGAMRQGQEYRQNQMLAQRRADALAAAQNYMRPPAVAATPAMQPGSSGPSITGGPLPPVGANTMGPAPAPAAPANAMRDITPLLQFAGDNGPIDALIAQHTRQETARATAAAQAIDDERLGSAEARARVTYTIDRAMPMLAQLTRDPSDATLDAQAARLLATPGIDTAYAEQQIAALRATPAEARAAMIADLMNVDAQGRAARAATFPDVRTFNDGTVIGGLPLSDPAAMTAPLPERKVTLTPNQLRTEQNRGEDRDTRLGDEQVRLDAEVAAADAEAAALAGNPRADRDAVAAAQAAAAAARAAAAANRRLRGGPPPRPAQTAPPRAADRGAPPPAPPAGTRRGATQTNARTGATWTWDGSRWQ